MEELQWEVRERVGRWIKVRVCVCRRGKVIREAIVGL